MILEFEYDTRETHFRAGGDIVGLRKKIPYLTGMGITCLYLAGTPFVNMPWGADGYSPLDFTLLDPHYGTVQEWRDTIDLLHDNGMQVNFKDDTDESDTSSWISQSLP